MSQDSRALQVIIPNGKPNGLKLIKMLGWDGLCYIVPRQSLSELAADSEVNNPGIYFLFGKDEASNVLAAYIGESEKFFERIVTHNTHKDFWDEAIVFTGDLNKAHVKYLEHRAVRLAKEAGRADLRNSTTPPENRLSDYDKVGVDLFFSNIQFVLEAFGYEIFKTVEESVSSIETYYLKGKGFQATARTLENGGMLVLAGSLASVAETPSFGGWAKAARQQFLESNKLVAEGDTYRFAEDIAFRSPSAAAATVAARSINGWTAWKDKKGSTLDENNRSL